MEKREKQVLISLTNIRIDPTNWKKGFINHFRFYWCSRLAGRRNSRNSRNTLTYTHTDLYLCP